ncbi:MAG: hypothetical protein A4E48_02664 [Methanosaeta sp. PtaU1.Bin060]|nr:MAG: hypothetical protein A4E48_02664 [Methanosaeta sp. PtaU1.Bin060]
MDIGSCDLDPSNQTKFLVHGIMQLVAEKGFGSFLRPSPIFTSPGLGFIAAKSICFSMAGISRDKCSILHDSLLHLKFHCVKLPLHLSPYFLVYASFSKAFSKLPYCCGIRNSLSCAKKHSKRDAIGNFAFKLLIGEVVKLLNEQRLEHHDNIEIRSPAAFGIVLVHGFKHRSEAFPI